MGTIGVRHEQLSANGCFMIGMLTFHCNVNYNFLFRLVDFLCFVYLTPHGLCLINLLLVPSMLF